MTSSQRHVGADRIMAPRVIRRDPFKCEDANPRIMTEPSKYELRLMAFLLLDPSRQPLRGRHGLIHGRNPGRADAQIVARQKSTAVEAQSTANVTTMWSASTATATP